MSKKRKKGAGTLRKRADGRWEARVVIGYDEKGLPLTKCVTALEKTKCLEKVRAAKRGSRSRKAQHRKIGYALR